MVSVLIENEKQSKRTKRGILIKVKRCMSLLDFSLLLSSGVKVIILSA